MIEFKIDVMEEMKKNGYSSGRIQKEKIIPGQTLQNIKNGNAKITTETLNKICAITRKQPGDILKFTATDAEKLKYY